LLRGLRPDKHAYFRARAAGSDASSSSSSKPVPSLLQARRRPATLCAPDASGLALADLALDASEGGRQLLHPQRARTLAFRVVSARGVGGSDGALSRPSDAALSARLCLMGGDGALRGASLSQGAQPAGLLSGGGSSWAFPTGAGGGSVGAGGAGIVVLRVPEASELEGARALRLYVELNAEAPLAAGEAARLPQSARLRTAQVTEATIAWCRVPLKYLFEAQPGDRVAAKLVSGPTPLASPGGVGAAAAAAVALQGGDRKWGVGFLRKGPAGPGGAASSEGQLEIEVMDLAQAVRWDPDLLPSEALVDEPVGTATAMFRQIVTQRVLRDKGAYSAPISSVPLRMWPRICADDDCRALFLADWSAAVARNGGRLEGLGKLFEASCGAYWPVLHAPSVPAAGLPNDTKLRQQRQATMRRILAAGPAAVFGGGAGFAQAPFDASETRFCLADRTNLDA
jgi:hypothetical protein